MNNFNYSLGMQNDRDSRDRFALNLDVSVLCHIDCNNQASVVGISKAFNSFFF